MSPSWDESGIFLAQRDGVKSSAMIAPSRSGSSNVNSCGCECGVVPKKVALRRIADACSMSKVPSAK